MLRRTLYRFTPHAAVRAVSARLLLLCLLFRSSWLTVEGGRQVGAAGVLHRRGGRQSWLCGSAWLVAFRCSSEPSRRVALLHFRRCGSLRSGLCLWPIAGVARMPVVTAHIALKRSLRVGAVAVTERRAPNRPPKRRLGLRAP